MIPVSLPEFSPSDLLKATVALFGTGGIGAAALELWRKRKGKADLRDARAPDVAAAEAVKEESDAKLVTALNGVAERWVDRAERKLQEAEDTIGRLRAEMHALRNELTKYKALELENDRLALRVERLELEKVALEAENAELRAHNAALMSQAVA